MNNINIFTDGSSLNNQNKLKRKGGIGIFFNDDDSRNRSIKITPDISKKVTNQIAELLACIYAIEIVLSGEIINNKNIIIYSDSMYVINSITKWGNNWLKNNWKKKNGQEIENKELIIKLYYYSKNLNIKYKHINSHKNPPDKSSDEYYIWYGNFMADKLAVSAANN